MSPGQSRPGRSRVVLALPRGWRWTGSPGLFFLAGLMLGFSSMWATHLWSPGGPAKAGSSPPTMMPTGPPPPWGWLERTPLLLERPEEYLQQDVAPVEIRWVFGGYTPAQLQALLESCGLSAPQLAQLLDRQRWEWRSPGITVRPPPELVLALEEGPRRRLYEALARTPENVAQRFPFVFRGTPETWLAGCTLRPEQLQALRRMTYRKGDVLCFSDLAWFQLTATTNEVRELVRHLSRVPTLLMKLRVDAHSDVPALVRYWGRGRPREDFRLLLEALARVPGGASLNVSYFLPPLPRLLLYHYPRPGAGAPPPSLNCVWTALNFFNAEPDARVLTDEGYVGQILRTQYERVPRAEALGDLIVLHETGADGAWRLVHACVHVADDVVFTKNGGDTFQPWVLMPLGKVTALFATEPSVHVAVFRRKGIE